MVGRNCEPCKTTPQPLELRVQRVWQSWLGWSWEHDSWKKSGKCHQWNQMCQSCPVFDYPLFSFVNNITYIMEIGTAKHQTCPPYDGKFTSPEMEEIYPIFLALKEWWKKSRKWVGQSLSSENFGQDVLISTDFRNVAVGKHCTKWHWTVEQISCDMMWDSIFWTFSSLESFVSVHKPLYYLGWIPKKKIGPPGSVSEEWNRPEWPGAARPRRSCSTIGIRTAWKKFLSWLK